MRSSYWLVLLGIGLVLVFFSRLDRNQWSLFVYPNGELTEETIKAIDSYNSFEECREGFKFSKRSLPQASFECGYKCKIQDASLGLYMCKETKD